MFPSLFGALTACVAERQSTPDAEVQAAARVAVDAPRSNAQDTIRICPVVPFVDDGTGSEVLEVDVTFEAFEDGTRYFETYLPKQLNDSTFMRPSFNEAEFWIGYHYNATYVRGYALRLAALAERRQRLPDTVSLADTATARSRFCRYLRAARLPD
ncbi:MAG: hypothetical protein Q8K82_26665 [Gemmatimonadaceae bacterium]|nr:hypothetical protein [Gemmatimonadaceae bacterium]